jgi:hypothetical protein
MNQPQSHDEQREARLRERLRARGFDLRRSSGAAPPANCGKYMVFDPVTGGTLLGHRFEAELDDIEAWLGEDQ